VLQLFFETAAHYSKSSNYVFKPASKLIYNKLTEESRKTLCATLDVPMARTGSIVSG